MNFKKKELERLTFYLARDEVRQSRPHTADESDRRLSLAFSVEIDYDCCKVGMTQLND